MKLVLQRTWRWHFCDLTGLTDDFSKPTCLPACTYLPHTTPCTQNTEKLRYSVDNPSEVVPTAV